MSVIYFSHAYRPAFPSNGALDFRRPSTQGNQPAYDIEKTGEQAYRITLAVPGFGIEDLAVTARPNELLVESKPLRNAGARHLRPGTVGHGFASRFDLDDHLEVVGSSLHNGLLTIELERRVPQAMRPKTIKINASSSKPKPIEQIGQRAASVFDSVARWFGNGRSWPVSARRILGW